MNKVLVVILGLVTFSMTACVSKIQADNFMLISDLKGEILYKIVEPSKLKLLNDEWQNKKQVLVKKMPKFEFIITVSENGIVSEWLYSKYGFTKLKQKSGGIIYRVKLSLKNKLFNTSIE